MNKIALSTLLLFCSMAVLAQHVPDSATIAEGWKYELAFRQDRDNIIQQNTGRPYVSFNVQSLDGDTFTNNQLKRKVLFITFWDDCCTSCMDNIDELKILYAKYKDNTDVQLISIARSDAGAAKEIAEKYKIPYPVCPVDGGEYSRLSYNMGSPLNIIVAKDGNMVLHEFGPINNQPKKPFFDQYQQTIEALLIEK